MLSIEFWPLAELIEPKGEVMNTNQPQTFDYIEEAHKTASDQFHGDKVPYDYFREVMARTIEVINELDAIKKTLFYGKPLPQAFDPMPGESTLNGALCWLSEDGLGDQAAANLFHGVIGKVTEAGELLEALSSCVLDGVSFDVTNCREEVGDGLWYDALIARACGFNFGEAQIVNIEKLRKRYPNKFTEADAINRDLTAERLILEQTPGEDHAE